jgi:hypothetical protein
VGKVTSESTKSKVLKIFVLCGKRYSALADVPQDTISRLAEVVGRNTRFAIRRSAVHTTEELLKAAILAPSSPGTGSGIVSLLAQALKISQQALTKAETDIDANHHEESSLRREMARYKHRADRAEGDASHEREKRHSGELLLREAKAGHARVSAQLDAALQAQFNTRDSTKTATTPNSERPTSNEVSKGMTTGVITSHRNIAAFKFQHTGSKAAPHFLEFLSTPSVKQLYQRLHSGLRYPTEKNPVMLQDPQGDTITLFHCCYATPGTESETFIAQAEHGGKWSCPTSIKNAEPLQTDKRTLIFGIITEPQLFLNGPDSNKSFKNNAFASIFADKETPTGKQKYKFVLKAGSYIPLKGGPRVLPARGMSHAALPSNGGSALPSHGGSFISSLNQPESEITKILQALRQWQGRATATSPRPHPFLTSDVKDIAKVVDRARKDSEAPRAK